MDLEAQAGPSGDSEPGLQTGIVIIREERREAVDIGLPPAHHGSSTPTVLSVPPGPGWPCAGSVERDVPLAATGAWQTVPTFAPTSKRGLV